MVRVVEDRPAIQLELALMPGPTADTPPPCPCCRGRQWLRAAAGWIACTWCEGSGVDPDRDLRGATAGRAA